MATKLNVNIRTLLANCEDLAKSEQNFWRLQKFIKSLDTMLDELEAMDDPQSAQRIPGYLERLQALKAATGYTEPAGAVHTNSSSQREFGENALKEVRQLQNTKHHNELRKELLQGKDSRRFLHRRITKCSFQRAMPYDDAGPKRRAQVPETPAFPTLPTT